MLKRVHIRGYKSLTDVEVALEPLTVPSSAGRRIDRAATKEVHGCWRSSLAVPRVPPVSVEDLSRGRSWTIVSVQPARLRRGPAPAAPSRSPHKGRRGVYAWYADSTAQTVLKRAGFDVRPDGLVYVGMTKNKGRTFRKRLRQHIRGGSDGDLRRKLSWVLRAAPAPAGADGDRFMQEHFTVVTIPMRVQPLRDEESISEAERRLIRELAPCMNRRGLPADSRNVKRLEGLRDAAGAATPRDGLFRWAMRAFRG